MGKYEVTEWCPHCESEITMTWDVQSMGYKAFCPVCGERLMLCDECQHSGPNGEYTDRCNYDSKTDTCRHNPAGKTTGSILRVETPLGAIIARPSYDSSYPGIWIDLRRPNVDSDMSVALIECTPAEGERGPELVTHVWGDAAQEDQTARIVHKDIEDYFRLEGAE